MEGLKNPQQKWVINVITTKNEGFTWVPHGTSTHHPLDFAQILDLPPPIFEDPDGPEANELRAPWGRGRDPGGPW